MRGRQIASPIARFRYDRSSASMVSSIVSNWATSALLMMSVIAALASNFRRKFFAAKPCPTLPSSAYEGRVGAASTSATLRIRTHPALAEVGEGEGSYDVADLSERSDPGRVDRPRLRPDGARSFGDLRRRPGGEFRPRGIRRGRHVCDLRVVHGIPARSTVRIVASRRVVLSRWLRLAGGADQPVRRAAGA